jgi:DNA-binding MarR family transcriptional regulator
MPGGEDDIYWIARKEQLEALISPLRHQIVDRLSVDGPMSIKELAHKLSCQAPRLYHHIEILLELGLVVQSGDRLVNRRREQLYSTPSPKVRVERALANRCPDVMNAVVSSMTRQMARDFAAGASHAAKIVDGDQRNFGFGRLIARPSKSQMQEMNACLTELGRILSESSDDEETAISFGWVLSPIE